MYQKAVWLAPFRFSSAYARAMHVNLIKTSPRTSESWDLIRLPNSKRCSIQISDLAVVFPSTAQGSPVAVTPTLHGSHN